MVALLLTLTLIVFVAVELFVARRVPSPMVAEPGPVAVLAPSPPASVFLCRNHTWARMTTEGGIMLGIDDLLAQLLGDIESVWTPAPGTHLRVGDPVLRICLAGRELTVPSPTAGVIERVNQKVMSAPWLISHDAYQSGWVVAMRPDDYHAAISGSRIGSEARAWLSEELRRAVDLLAGTRQVAGAPILADGAVPSRGAVAMLESDRFDEFARAFVGTAISTEPT